VSSAPIVSVILPTYNRAKLLPRAIESVLSQDFENLELLVIDDGSKDETPQVLAEVRDPRLHISRFQQNRGIGAGRHEGVSLARGELIAFVDSDDVWLPGKLAYQVQVMRRHPSVDILFSDYRNINSLSGTSQNGFSQTQRGFHRLKLLQLEPDLWQIDDGLPQALLTANFIGTCSMVMIRRQVFLRVGNFDPTLSGPEDFEFWWRASLCDTVFAFSTRTLVERHKDRESITAGEITFIGRYLRALEICEFTARDAGRTNLRSELNQARHSVWRYLIRAHATLGQRRQACAAFRQSLRYAFSLKACAYFAAALAGPGIIAAGNRFRRVAPGVE